MKGAVVTVCEDTLTAWPIDRPDKAKVVLATDVTQDCLIKQRSQHTVSNKVTYLIDPDARATGLGILRLPQHNRLIG